jgi:hypothetical protein
MKGFASAEVFILGSCPPLLYVFNADPKDRSEECIEAN